MTNTNNFRTRTSDMVSNLLASLEGKRNAQKEVKVAYNLLRNQQTSAVLMSSASAQH